MLCLSHLVKSKLTYRVFKLKSAGGQTFVAKGAAGVKQSGPSFDKSLKILKFRFESDWDFIFCCSKTLVACIATKIKN